MKSTITRAILLVAPVIDALQEQLAADFPLLRLYEQEDPIAFLREQGENIAAVVTRGDIGVQNSVLELLPHVGLIAIFGVGTDAVDLEYVRSRQIQVSITSGVLTNDVADLAMGLLLAGSRNLCQGDRFVREGGVRNRFGVLHYCLRSQIKWLYRSAASTSMPEPSERCPPEDGAGRWHQIGALLSESVQGGCKRWRKGNGKALPPVFCKWHIMCFSIGCACFAVCLYKGRSRVGRMGVTLFMS